MTDRVSCKEGPIIVNGKEYQPIRWGEERRPRHYAQPDFCRDCSTPLGGVHHPGCCVEKCPVCLGQALGCPDFEEPESECEFSGRTPARCTSHLFRQAGRD
jgi:hypothetical protein